MISNRAKLSASITNLSGIGALVCNGGGDSCCRIFPLRIARYGYFSYYRKARRDFGQLDAYGRFVFFAGSL
jgi:hypothetical protein